VGGIDPLLTVDTVRSDKPLLVVVPLVTDTAGEIFPAPLDRENNCTGAFEPKPAAPAPNQPANPGVLDRDFSKMFSLDCISDPDAEAVVSTAFGSLNDETEMLVSRPKLKESANAVFR